MLQGFQLNEALQFQKQKADTFPLSEPAKNFIKKSIWQKRLNFLKVSSLMIIPVLIVGAPVERNVREDNVKRDYSRLDSENKFEKKQAIQALVAGCSATKSYSVVPKYLLERVFGNCRSLKGASLSKADLSDANLRSAALSQAIFLVTDLRAKELIQEQLEGENPPYICNSPLPDNIKIEGGKDRDCDKLADILHEKYPDSFENPEAAAKFVNEQRQKTWE